MDIYIQIHNTYKLGLIKHEIRFDLISYVFFFFNHWTQGRIQEFVRGGAYTRWGLKTPCNP